MLKGVQDERLLGVMTQEQARGLVRKRALDAWMTGVAPYSLENVRVMLGRMVDEFPEEIEDNNTITYSHAFYAAVFDDPSLREEFERAILTRYYGAKW